MKISVKLGIMTNTSEGFEALSVKLIMDVVFREKKRKNLTGIQTKELFEELFPAVRVLISDEAQTAGIFSINFYKVRRIVEKHLEFLGE